jgi:hypothetical protein
MIFSFILFYLKHDGRADLTSHGHPQVKLIGRNFICTPLGLNPGPCLVSGSQIGLKSHFGLKYKNGQKPSQQQRLKDQRKKPRDHPPTTTEKPQQTLPESRKPGINK